MTPTFFGNNKNRASGSNLYHILVAGQSNAEGGGEVGAGLIGTYTAANGYKFSGGMKPDEGTHLASFVPLSEEINSTGSYDANRVQNITVGSAMVNMLSHLMAGDNKFLVSNEGYSGLGMSQITKGGGCPAYANHIAQVTVANSLAVATGRRYSVLAVVLEHGEFDDSIQAGVAYRTWLRTIQQDYNTDICAITGQTTPVRLFVSQPAIPDWNHLGTGTGQIDPILLNAQTVQAMFLAAGDYPADIVLATSMYPAYYVQPHCCDAWQKLAAEYFANAIANHSAVNPWAPIRPTSAHLSGTSIVVNFSVLYGPLVWDKTCSVGSVAHGFEYQDSNLLTTNLVTAATITSPTQVTLTLASAPTGTSPVVRYGFGLLPPAAGNQWDCSPRGDLFDSCTLQSLLTDMGRSIPLINPCPMFVLPIT